MDSEWIACIQYCIYKDWMAGIPNKFTRCVWQLAYSVNLQPCIGWQLYAQWMNNEGVAVILHWGALMHGHNISVHIYTYVKNVIVTSNEWLLNNGNKVSHIMINGIRLIKWWILCTILLSFACTCISSIMNWSH